MFSLIVAVGKNGEVGRGNKLLWDIPEDMQWFKDNTIGRNIIMGRKTYESIGRPLPNRNNIVLTRDKEFVSEGVEVIHDPFDLDLSKDYVVIGGSQVYREYMNHVTELFISRVHSEFPLADSFFPEINYGKLVLVYYSKIVTKTGIPLTFERYRKKEGGSLLL